MKCYPKLHYPALLSRCSPAGFGITAFPTEKPPQVVFFLDVGRVWSSTKNPPGIIQGLPIPWNLGFLGSAHTPNSCCSEGGWILFLYFILESQIQGIWGSLGNQCLQFCLWMGGSSTDQLGIPGLRGPGGGFIPFPRILPTPPVLWDGEDPKFRPHLGKIQQNSSHALEKSSWILLS